MRIEKDSKDNNVQELLSWCFMWANYWCFAIVDRPWI